MKRRRFLVHSSVGATLAAVPGSLLARPCPAPRFEVSPLPAVRSACTTAEADWIRRTSVPGVVWFHDFRNPAEITQFAWSAGFGGGNDPTMESPEVNAGTEVLHQAADGPTGFCLEALHPVGPEPRTTWWRPLSPMSIGNGRGEPDPGDGLPLQSWEPTRRGSQTTGWSNGFYGHPGHGTFDGRDIYLQVRVKMDPRRISGGNEAHAVGKAVWLTLCSRSLTDQEHVFYSYGNGGNQGPGRNYLRCYVKEGGRGGFSPLNTYNNPGGRIQPGSELAEDWSYSGGWDCLLIHVRMGLQDVASGPDAMRLEVWAATEPAILNGDGYSKIWDQEYPLLDFQGENPSRYGLQALLLSSFNNGNSFAQDFWHRYTQVIFSRQPIPCPLV